MTPEARRIQKFREKEAENRLCGDGKLPALTADSRWHLLKLAIDHIGTDTPLTVLEFGVAKGQSLAAFARLCVNPQTRLIGFDSFEGLPEDWVPGPVLAKGTFSTNGKVPAIADERVSFVEGWFQNTVPAFLASPPADLSRTVLVHYDADLYSSTLFLLTTLWHHLRDYYFILDDLPFEEFVALDDFSKAYPVEVEWIAKRINPFGTPVQLFGRMRRTEYAPR